MDTVEPILSLCSTIYHMAANVKANKERCQRIAQRVRALEELVLNIKQRGPGQISGVVENPLRELCTTLASAKALMTKYSQTKPVKRFLKSSSHEEEFDKLHQRLTHDHLVLSTALQIEQWNKLHQVMETFSGRRQDGVYYSEQHRGVTGTLLQRPYGFIVPMPPSITPPSPQCGTFAPRPLSTAIASRPATISYTTAPNSVLGLLAPIKAHMLLTRPTAPTTFPSQNTFLL